MKTLPKSGFSCHGLWKTAMLVWTCVLCALSLQATEWFVDKNRPNDDGDGRSEATAKRTIQAAVDAASQGDTITVLPGDYDEGLTEIAAGDYKHRARVYISKKNLVLRSRDGAAVTHIVGQHDSATEANTSRYGIGDNAIRCIMFTNNTDAANCIVKGFTIRDGASAYVGSDNGVTYGGGVYCPGYKNGSSIVVMDCVIRNCVAMRGGGAANVSLVRSLVTYCRASTSGAAGRYLWAYNCVFTKNRNFLGDTSSVAVLTYSKIANCDIVENNMYTIDTNVDGVYNSVFFGNQGDSGNISVLSAKCHNCLSDISTLTADDCFTGDYKTSVFAPAIQDFRVVSGGAADGSGNVSYLNQIPVAYRDTDYYGNPRKTGDSVNVGAVEGRAVSRGRFVFNKDHRISVNGLPQLVRDSHVNVEAVPCPIRIRIGAAADETREIVRIRCSDSSHSFYPEWDGSFVVTPFSSGEFSIAEIIRGKTVYADAEATGETEDGSDTNPFHTLQSAVDDVGNDNGVVLLRRGHYNKGEKLSAGSVSNRCDFGGTGYCIVRALEGPDVTFVHGKSASVSLTGDGRGTDAVRCFGKSGSGRVAVVGLTVCDGRVGVTANNADGNDVRGGAVYSSSDNANSTMYLIDCAISNNLATRGGVGFAKNGMLAFVRCRITGNRTPGNALLRNCVAVNSLFYGNGAEGETCSAIGQTASAYNSTIYGNQNCRGFEANLAKYVANSVFAGAASDKVSASTGNNVYNTLYVTTGTAEDLSEKNVIQGDPVMADPANGDFRLTTLSSAKSLAAFAQAFYQMNFPLDAFGNAYTVDADGRFEAGGVAGIVPAVRVSSRCVGGVRPYEGKVSPIGVVSLEGADTLTLTPTGDRRLLGYTVDGVFVKASGAYTFPIDSGNPPASITADYAPRAMAISFK